MAVVTKVFVEDLAIAQDLEDRLRSFGSHAFEMSRKDHDREKLKGIIDLFGQIIEQYLHDEIPVPPSLHRMDITKLEHVWVRTQKAVETGLDTYRHRPMAFGCIDKAFKIDRILASFPAAPFFRAICGPLRVLSSSLWRMEINSCTVFEAPRPLQPTS
jgi:hypothetical protein